MVLIGASLLPPAASLRRRLPSHSFELFLVQDAVLVGVGVLERIELPCMFGMPALALGVPFLQESPELLLGDHLVAVGIDFIEGRRCRRARVVVGEGCGAEAEGQHHSCRYS
jgi:hypothetical protein